MEDNQATDEVKCSFCCIPCCRNQKQEPQPIYQSLEESTNQLNTPVYSATLPQPLHPGICISVFGTPQETCTRFSVNLQCETKSKSKPPDTAFHFNPRLEQDYIVRNSYRGGRWDTEETISCFRYELTQLKKFKISFFIAPKEYMVSINDRHFCTFGFRIPLARVNFIEIRGDVIVHDIEVDDEVTHYPFKKFGDDVSRVLVGDVSAVNDNETLPNPFIGHLPNGFQIGWQLEIFGKIKLLPHSFYINIQEGNYYWPHPIIPLHLNPRFNTLVGSNSLVRNSWSNGAWGTEERAPDFHFTPGRKFHIIIRMEAEYFSVWLDGKMEGEFKFRTSVNNIDTVYIQGDLIIYKVFMNDKCSNMFMNNINR